MSEYFKYFFFQYKFYILLAITLPYLTWAFTLDIPSWTKFLLWLFNPYTIYGLAILWIKRESLVGAYDMMVGYWRARRLYKEDPDEYVRVMTEEGVDEVED